MYYDIYKINQKILKKDILEKLKQSEREIENGQGIEAEEAFKELREKYGYESI